MEGVLKPPFFRMRRYQEGAAVLFLYRNHGKTTIICFFIITLSADPCSFRHNIIHKDDLAAAGIVGSRQQHSFAGDA